MLANEITGTETGEIFVHRNIAKMVVHTDVNFLSVLQYAIEVLHVKHIIVCGHYGCGGVLTAMSKTRMGLVNTWIRNIKEVYVKPWEELEAIEDIKKTGRSPCRARCVRAGEKSSQNFMCSAGMGNPKRGNSWLGVRPGFRPDKRPEGEST